MFVSPRQNMTDLSTHFKNKLYNQCKSLVQEKLELLNSAYAESREALGSEAKSTAGDKHETGRAMIQLEQEKMGRQLAETQKLQNILARINADKIYERVQSGALVKADTGLYFIAVGIGKLEVEGNDVFVMAPTSPLAQAMLGKVKGEQICLNGNTQTILSVI